MIRNIFVALFLFLPLLGLTQSRKVWMYHADNFYQKADYQNALVNYKNALSDSTGMQFMTIPYEITQSNLKIDKSKTEIDSGRVVPVKDYLEHQIASCYMKTYDYNRALEQFKKTSTFESYPEDLYYYGVAQMNVKQHKEAIATFEQYIKSDKYNDSLLRSAQLLITGCFYALDESHFKEKVSIAMLDTIIFNTGTSSFAPMYFGHENRLMFTSARPGGVILDPTKQQSEFLCDIYYTEKENDKWGPATNFGRPLNSAQHDASSYFSDKNIVYYTRWNDDNRKEQAIHLARMVDFKFYESFKLPESVNVPGYRSINPFVTMDGKWLIFSSDRPGGEGGLDLWKIELDETGNVMGDAINLGRPINSELDEQTPYFHEVASTLFFSSNGHNSIGGLDIFKAAYDKENGVYSNPVNMGMPINSSMDDAYMIWDSYMHKGFFASDREPCENGHCYDIYEVTNEPILIAIEGYAYDAETEEILPNTTLTFKDIEFKFESFEIKTDANGFYHQDLEKNQDIFIKATKEKYFADAANISTKPVTQTTTLMQDFYLRPIPTDEIEIEGIEYDFDKATLREKSKEILDELYEFLEFNNTLVVEINSHTDERGSDAYNLKLSQERAKSCVDYLISKGVDKNRLKAVGYGESSPNFLKGADKKPILDSDGKRIILSPAFIYAEPNEAKREEYHQRNRRTSFKVVGDGYKVISN